MSDVVVRIPAKPEFIHVLRTTVASVAARLDFSYDAIDDLRIAVDEACSQLLAVPGDASELTLRISPRSPGLVLTASIDAGPVEWPPPGAEHTLAWQVLNALTDQVAFEHEGGGAALRLEKRDGSSVP